MGARISIALFLCLLVRSAIGDEPETNATRHSLCHLRRPVSAGLLAEGRVLVLANQRSGSVSLVDLATNKVTAEVPVGAQLSGLAVLAGGKQILVTDDKRHELVLLDAAGASPRVKSRIAVAAYPASVSVAADGKRAMVAGLWSRTLQIVDLPKFKVEHSVPLSFAPRLQLPLPDTWHVVVADAFGGALAVVDVECGRVVAKYELEAHNLCGLALTFGGKELLVAHQILDQKRPVTEAAIEQGLLMRNVVRRMPLAELVKANGTRSVPATFRLDDGWIHGAADPAGIAMLGEHGVVIALAGNNSVAVLDAEFKVERRINVGSRPTQILREPGGDLLVVNTLSDSISRIDPAYEKIPCEISLGPAPKLSSRERGELLFHDASLSLHGWMSCQSCHPGGHTNGLLADTSGDNTFGAPKRTLTLLGTAITDRWAWNGSQHYLHEQVRKSFDSTLHGSWASADNVRDLSDYLHTLPPPPAAEPPRADKADREQLARGRKLFTDRGCAKCHVPPLAYTSFDSYDVGFTDERGTKKFNPPSLRGVSQGKRFFHDNRADSLEAIFTEHGHGLEDDLSGPDLADLLRFLRSL